jgi:hypothetical protein
VLELGVEGLGLPVDRPYRVTDLLDGTTRQWVGSAIPIDLDPAERGAHMFWLRPA